MEITDIIKSIDTMWVLIAAVLVFFMQAWFALLEAGLCRMKNAWHTAMKNFMIFAIATVVFWAIWFAVSFWTWTSWFGTSWFFLNWNESEVFSSLASFNIPIYVKFLFQVVFLWASLAIVWWWMAERTKFSIYLIFWILYSALIYPVVAHWVWWWWWLWGIWMQDFAGSTVVHLQWAAAALAWSMLLGPRLWKYNKDWSSNIIKWHNVTMIILGTFILWFGWFWFNPWSTLSVLKPEPWFFAYVAFTTNLAAWCWFLAGLLWSWFLTKKADILMWINWALAALVAITAACAFVTPFAAAFIWLIAWLIAYFWVWFIDRRKIDDPVWAIAVHWLWGIWWTLALWLFAAPDLVKLVWIWNPWLLYWWWFTQLIIQFKWVLWAFVYVFIASFIVFWILKKTIWIRLSVAEEEAWLDQSEHSIDAYPEIRELRTKS